MKKISLTGVLLILAPLMLGGCGSGGSDGEIVTIEPGSNTGDSDTTADESAAEDSDDVADDDSDDDSTPTTAQSDVDEETESDDFLVYDSFHLVAQDGYYLGEINFNEYDSDSVCNAYGTYGSGSSTYSIWNIYGKYGSDYSSYSAFSVYASYPPIILRNGYAWAYLSVNPYKSPRVDSYFLLDLLQIMGCEVE